MAPASPGTSELEKSAPARGTWRADGWRPIDCHAHTTMSDGVLSIEEVLALAQRLDVRPSITDHLSRDVGKAIDSIEKVEGYLDALEKHQVARGGEFCWHDNLWREVPNALRRRFTHWIGSLHGIRLDDGTLVHAFGKGLPDGLTPQAYMSAHSANAERFAREMPVDILAHPTLVPIPLRKLPPEELWSEEAEERLVNALASAGIVFEISNRYRPHDAIVQRAKAAGLRFSLGSDGHTKEQVARIAGPLALARHLGVRDEDLYDPYAHGSKTQR